MSYTNEDRQAEIDSIKDEMEQVRNSNLSEEEKQDELENLEWDLADEADKQTDEENKAIHEENLKRIEESKQKYKETEAQKKEEENKASEESLSDTETIEPIKPPIKKEVAGMELPPKRKIGYLEAYMDPDLMSQDYRENNHYSSTIKREEMGGVFEDNQKLNFGTPIQLSKVAKRVKEIPSTKKKSKWPTDSLRNFLYNTDNEGFNKANDKYQDPTWLGFEIIIIADESPLYNYAGVGNSSTVAKFLAKYGSNYETGIPEMVERTDVYRRFIRELSQYFAISTDRDENVIFNKRHYIESVDGLGKLNAKMVKYEEDIIEVQINEDVSLRTQYMIELYNNLVYDYKYKRTMIPENLLRFNMYIKIKDIRPIKVQNPNYNPDTSPEWEVLMDTIGAGETYTLYKLYDCNFDFSESQTHEGTIVMGGWSAFNTGNMNNTKFKIKYKSISKEFESNLVGDEEVVTINSHNLEFMTLTNLNNSFLKNMNDYTYMKAVDDGEKAPDDISIVDEGNGKTKMGELLSKVGNSDIIGKKVGDFKKLGDDKIRSVTNGIKGKFSEVRGALITDLKKTITDALPWDRLGNVYSTDFRQMSLQNFGKELVSDVIDTAIDPNELMELTDVKFKPPTIDGGFTKPKTAFSKKGYLGDINKIGK